MPSKTSAADILARFPGPVTLYPSLKQWGLIFAGCAVFALIGQWMARSGQQVMGWAVLMFFGAGTVIAAFAMLPRAAALTLDASGFEIMNFYRRRRTRWQDAGDFTAARIPPARARFVLFNTSQVGPKVAKLNTFVGGCNAALPDTYGRSPDDLAQLMTQWRERATGSIGFTG